MSTRVFAPAHLLPGELTLSREESHYLVRVRRVHPGDPVEVIALEGGGWRGVVLAADPRRVQLRVDAELPERPYRPVDLAVGLVDAKAAYETVARATEAGARSLRFLHTRRSLPTMLNLDRVDRVVRAAQRQCGRLQRLQVCEPAHLDDWLGSRPAGFVASVRRPLPEAATGLDRAGCSVLIGPEGGLTPEEEQHALGAGLRPLSLGPYVLRTQFAVVAALSLAEAPRSI